MYFSIPSIKLLNVFFFGPIIPSGLVPFFHTGTSKLLRHSPPAIPPGLELAKHHQTPEALTTCHTTWIGASKT